jgi:hypothetical protein
LESQNSPVNALSVPFLRRTSNDKGDGKDSFHSTSDLTIAGEGFFGEDDEKKTPARTDVPAEPARIRRRAATKEMAPRVEIMTPTDLQLILQDPSKRARIDYLIVDVRDDDFAVTSLSESRVI